jgi:hypothetical protein
VKPSVRVWHSRRRCWVSTCGPGILPFPQSIVRPSLLQQWPACSCEFDFQFLFGTVLNHDQNEVIHNPLVSLVLAEASNVSILMAAWSGLALELAVVADGYAEYLFDDQLTDRRAWI